MSKKYRVKRYDYRNGGQYTETIYRARKIATTAAIAAVVGWVSFTPVNNFLGNIDMNWQGEDGANGNTVPEVPVVTPSLADGLSEMQNVDELPSNIYYLPEEVMLDNSLLNTALVNIKNLGGTGVAFDVKNPDGLVLYDSDLEIVKENATVVSENTFSLKTIVDTIKKAELEPIARVYTFYDSTAPFTFRNAGVKYQDSEVNWIDNAKADGGKPWLNPASEEAQDYILQILQEVFSQNLQYIILDGVQFPDGYSLQLATYGVEVNANSKSDILASFLAEAQKTADNFSGEIWPVVQLSSLIGLADVSQGANSTKLLNAVGRGIVDVSPVQFGNGVTTDEFTIYSPIEMPYNAVATGLEQVSQKLEMTNISWLAMVQNYTAYQDNLLTVIYGETEVGQQVSAVNQYDIDKILYYNPYGEY